MRRKGFSFESNQVGVKRLDGMAGEVQQPHFLGDERADGEAGQLAKGRTRRAFGALDKIGEKLLDITAIVSACLVFKGSMNVDIEGLGVPDGKQDHGRIRRLGARLRRTEFKDTELQFFVCQSAAFFLAHGIPRNDGI